jgi:photosystem II stability/assembly factor-like uncharacterized protein
MLAMTRVVVIRSALAVILLLPSLSAAQISSSINTLAIDPQTPTTLYAATSDGRVLKSTDGGVNWSATGLANSGAITALAVDPQSPGTVYATSVIIYEGSTVFKTVDGGVSWSAISNSGLRLIYATRLAVDAQIPTMLYMVASGGMLSSTDGGATWNYVSFPGPLAPADFAMVEGLAVDRLNPQTVYASLYYHAAASEGSDETNFGQVFKSVDGGANWSCVLCADWWSLEPFPAPVGLLAVAPQTSQNPATVYVADLNGDTIRKTVDDGRNWVPITSVPETCCVGLQLLAVDDRNPATVYVALVDAGVFKTIDGGTTWTAANVGLPDPRSASIQALVFDPQDSATLYLGTTFGVFKSTDGGASWTPTGLVQHSPLTSLSIDPASVPPGGSTTGTVKLLAPAPAGGLTVTASSDNPAVTVPAMVTVPAGSTEANFPISTVPVPNYVWVTISVFHDNAMRSAQFFLNARVIPSSLGLYPSSVTAGTSSGGLLTLSTDAPEGGAVVVLSSSAPAVATVPANVTVQAWMPNAWFTVSTLSGGPSGTVTISATYSGVTTSAVLTVNPAVTLASLTLSPASVTGGTPATGAVTLTSAAPPGGAVVTLSSSNAAAASVPASVTVPEGVTSATFPASTKACISGSVAIFAAYGGVTKSAPLTVSVTSDSVAIQTADYSAGKHVLRVDATSTNSVATLSVFESTSRTFIGTLTHYDGSRYRGQFTWPVNPRNITVQSDRCGSATRDVTLK